MAAPSNRFDKVAGPEPGAITVTLSPRPAGGPSGEVLGPVNAPGEPFRAGEDGSLSAHQALAVACHLANEIDRPVVIRDDDGCWQPAWGRLEAG